MIGHPYRWIAARRFAGTGTRREYAGPLLRSDRRSHVAHGNTLEGAGPDAYQGGDRPDGFRALRTDHVRLRPDGTLRRCFSTPLATTAASYFTVLSILERYRTIGDILTG